MDKSIMTAVLVTYVPGLHIYCGKSLEGFIDMPSSQFKFVYNLTPDRPNQYLANWTIL